jgi:ABC-type multidrug transport system ATPase subunit
MDTQNTGKNSRITAKPDGAVVAFRHVTQCFDSLWGGKQVRALAGVSFEVRRGEIFGLLGPAGAGKSTVAGLLTGHYSPTEGSVKVFGRSPRGWLTRARVAGLRQSAPPAALAQLLLKDPELVVLDEPFANLDSAARTALQELARALAREGKTIILASRNLADLKDVCDRIAVLASGKVHAVGNLNELLDSVEALPWLILTLPSSISRALLQNTRAELERAASPVSSLAGQRETPAGPGLVGPQRGESLPLLAELRPGASGPDSRSGAVDATTEATEEILARLVKPGAPAAPGR